MREIWRVISEFPDYSVSSLGRVKRIVPDRHGRIIAGILKLTLGNHGYLAITLHKDAKQTTRLVHRLVCAAFHGNPSKGKTHAAHRDGNKTNNLKGNVRWSTPSANNMEKHLHGTMRVGDNHHARYMPECMPRGSSHGNSKLTEKSVKNILRDNRSQRVIAAELGVTQSLISMVKMRKIWRHV